MKLKGKVAFITGGAKGIGFGCAKVFDKYGATVVIGDIDEKTGPDAAKQLMNGHFVKCDVTSEEAMRDAIDGAARKHGHLDVVVNNAGWHPPAMSIDDTSVAYFESQIRMNLTSTFMGCKFAIPHLRKTKGSIVVIASFAGTHGQPNACAYAASKCAQIGLMRALALDFSKDDVRINAICPSNVMTPLMKEWAGSLNNPAEALSLVESFQPINRMASIEEMGEVAAFLASDESSFITGQALMADGGASLGYGVKAIKQK